MAVNIDKPHLWKADTDASVDFYNDWYMNFAPQVYRDRRVDVTKRVVVALKATDDLRNISPALLRQHPLVLPMLRMATAPPLARDRLSGLADVTRTLIVNMEERGRVPPRMDTNDLNAALTRIGQIIERMADEEIFPWLQSGNTPTEMQRTRAATIVADRLLGSEADPVIRNAQERRQLASIQTWLEGRGYRLVTNSDYTQMQPGTFSFRLSVRGQLDDGNGVNIPVDAVIMPLTAQPGDLPILVEAKSAGDFANVNKRRKEEAKKVSDLRRANGTGVRFILFLCGYFDAGYLGYAASDNIDWVWEHRIDDLAQFGI
jgi:hypothetical protein